MKLKLVLATLLSLAGIAPAWSQCTGQPASGLVCGNPSAGTALPAWSTITLLFDRSFGTTQGTILNRGASSWSETSTPTLGLNGGAGGSLAFKGATSGTATVGVKAVAGTTTFNLPVGNGTSGFVLITDGSGNTSWANNASGGTVQSVALALPSSILTVSGSPVTTTGTLTGALATQSVNTVWSGPTSGVAATPTFRSLVGADLPNPSATTLGGVESLVGVTSNWIRSISTSGVPVASQPAFTDISGSLAPAQCPNPSASTIGCVQSYVAVAHQWINSISTAGVPSSAQPNFTDLSGSATLAQLPVISNNSVLGNNSGGTAIPATLTTSNVLDFIATTQGDVLYRNGSIWTALPPGTSGQVLTTGGAAANPSWTTVTGTGTVTSVATNNGLTGGPVTTTGTLGLATITAGTVLANVTGSGAVPIANTPSSILDVIGSATGDILYRSSGGWAVLAPGTNGQVLTQGASTPAWGSAGSVSSVATGQGLSGGTITTSGTLTTAAGVPTNTLNTQTANYTIATTDCGKTVQLGTGTSGLFTVTLPSVSGFAATCNVTVVNGDTGRGKIEAGFPAGFSNGQNILWPNQAGEVQIVNGAWSTKVRPGRWKTPSSLTLFSNSGGSNTGDCLATGAAGACASTQAALYIACNEFDFTGLQAGQTLFVVQLDNNDTNGIHYSCRTQVGAQGGASIVIQGAAPNVVLSGSGSDAVGVFTNAILQVRSLTLATTGTGACVTADLHAQVYILDQVSLNACASAHFSVSNNSDIYINSNYAIFGNAPFHFLAQNGGHISTTATVVAAFGASITVTDWALAGQLGGVIVPNWSASLSGFTVTGTRSSAVNMGLVYTGAGNTACTTTYFPGSVNGGTSGGGQCL